METKNRLTEIENKENRNTQEEPFTRTNGKCKKCETLIITNGELLKKMKRMGRQGSQAR